MPEKQSALPAHEARSYLQSRERQILRVAILLVAAFILNCLAQGAACITAARSKGLELRIKIKFDGFGYGATPHAATYNKDTFWKNVDELGNVIRVQYGVSEGPGGLLFAVGSRLGPVIVVALFAGAYVLTWLWLCGRRVSLAALLVLMLGISTLIGTFANLNRGHEAWGPYAVYIPLLAFGVAVWLERRHER